MGFVSFFCKSAYSIEDWRIFGKECEFSSISGTLRMLYHDQVYQYVINEHEYFSHVFQGKWYEGCVTFRICTQEFLRWVHQLNF